MAEKSREPEPPGTEEDRSAAGAQEKRKDAQQKRKKTNKSENPEWKPARQLNTTDWQLIRYAVVAEGMSYAAAGREALINPATIRLRAKRERWHDEDQIRLMPTTEEAIIMRNQREIMRTLKVMEGKLDVAMLSDDPDAAKRATGKAELVGKYARATQSLARASEVNASARRKVKAHDKPRPKPQTDREALERRLLAIDEKREQALLSGEPERQ